MGLLELSNFGCLPSRAGGSPFCTSGFGLNYEAIAKENLDGRDDLDARLYLAVGEAEGALLSGMVTAGMNGVVELLGKYDFSSFKMTSTILPGQDHFTIVPTMLMEGTRWMWSEELVGEAWMMNMAQGMMASQE